MKLACVIRINLPCCLIGHVFFRPVGFILSCLTIKANEKFLHRSCFIDRCILKNTWVLYHTTIFTSEKKSNAPVHRIFQINTPTFISQLGHFDLPAIFFKSFIASMRDSIETYILSNLTRFSNKKLNKAELPYNNILQSKSYLGIAYISF